MYINIWMNINGYMFLWFRFKVYMYIRQGYIQIEARRIYLHHVCEQIYPSNARFRRNFDPELCIRRPLFCFTHGHYQIIIQTSYNHHWNITQSSPIHDTNITKMPYTQHQNIVQILPKHYINIVNKSVPSSASSSSVRSSVRPSVHRRRPFCVRPSRCLFPHRCPSTA